jgi:hypothetical protein
MEVSGVGAGVTGGVVGQPDGQRGDQLAAAGLGQDPAAHAGTQEMQLGLAELAFHAEQHPVAEIAGIIKAVFVADQRAAQGADFQQPVPVGVVPGQPGALQARDDPGRAHADVGDQPLESFPVGGRSAGLALADVDNDDLVAAPPERDRPPAQVVLPQRGFGVAEDLLERGLADIQAGVAAQMRGTHLGGGMRGGVHHGFRPSCTRASRIIGWLRASSPPARR